jgi:hypothetical protein
VPPWWEVAAGALAEIFHIQPSELAAMDADDVEFWLDRLKDRHGKR